VCVRTSAKWAEMKGFLKSRVLLCSVGLLISPFHRAVSIYFAEILLSTLHFLSLKSVHNLYSMIVSLEFCTFKKPGVAQLLNRTHFRFCIDLILLAKRSISVSST